MFDFNITQVTRGGLLFCFVFYLFILIKYWRIYGLRPDFPYLPRMSKGIAWLVFIFSVCSWTNGDWFHYLQIVKGLRVEMSDGTGMEWFYDTIIMLTRRNYLSFRLIVWGLASYVFFIALKKYKLNPGYGFYLLLVVFINYFDYSRSALGITTYFLGLPLIFGEGNIKSKWMGLALICLAPFFHRSVVVLTALTITGIVSINKKTILLLIVVLGLSFFSLKEYFIEIMGEVINSGGQLGDKASFYMTQKREAIVSGTIIGQAVGYWKYSVCYVYFLVETYYIFNENNYRMHTYPIRATYNVTLGLFAFAILMYFFNVGHMAFYFRYLSMTYVPLIIMAVYQYRRRIMPSMIYHIMMYFGGGYVAFEFLYRIAIGQ